MEDPHFPNLEIDIADLWSIRIIAQLQAENPSYLDHPACPYDPDVIDALKQILAVGASLNKASNEGTEDEIDLENIDLEAEAARIYKELRGFKANLASDDKSELNTYFRLSTTLMEKLLDIKEKAVSQKQAEEFIEVVLAVMEDELDPDTRERILKRLNATIGEE